uniref:Ig-like domain-containing protein n=1 Tax=Mastacembelus armatus TaxID=205130 RepID=A0A3Q3LHH7_9TELE
SVHTRFNHNLARSTVSWSALKPAAGRCSESTNYSRIFVSVKTGGNVTLQCFYQSDVATRFYWYKQTLGQKPRIISSYHKYDKTGHFQNEFNNPRFMLETGNGENHLAITDLSISDSGTYYCASSYSYMFDVAEGTVVSVQGSGSNIPAQVHQSASESIQPGGSVTLGCTVHTGTCDGEHRVYWFKHSGQAHPGLIYTHGGSNDQCERKPETQTHSCVYNLRMNSLNLSDAGTYYCAVASCGHMLFGNGTRLDLEVLINSNACSCIKQNISTNTTEHGHTLYYIKCALTKHPIMTSDLGFALSVYEKWSKTASCAEGI